MPDNIDINGFCRNCLKLYETGSKSAHLCESPKTLAHKELFELTIAHLDCDAFYAAIEKRDDPSLTHKPVIVGGGQRGVVSTCCYIARTYGIHSAMPMFKALKACPDAVVIRPNFEKYSEAGGAVREMMRALTPLVEPLSIDEAFMDLTGTQRLHGEPPAMALARLQTRIKKEIGVTVSIGLSHNKFLAKIASDFDKPSGFHVIGKEETLSFLASQPIKLIWGIGAKTSAKLAKDGLRTIAQLQQMDEAILIQRYGETGQRLARLARGEDRREVSISRETKSVSAETTFNTDIADRQLLEDKLWELCEKVSARMKQKSFFGRVVTLKLKTNKFKTITRRTTLDQPSNLARTAFDTARQLLANEADGQFFRLIGVGYSGLLPADKQNRQAEFFDDGRKRLVAQEGAVDSIRAKFGDDVIGSARALKKK